MFYAVNATYIKFIIKFLLSILLQRHSDVCCLNSVRKNSTIELKLVKVPILSLIVPKGLNVW